ncbi:hypothetical protein SDC9_21341 [bioreactor metagenome]|uniref:Uncharacterized protein n=1 Tax=bioreactor metagenome TaxID=1076179 RepID=A0A644U990_9ZZZZ
MQRALGQKRGEMAEKPQEREAEEPFLGGKAVCLGRDLVAPPQPQRAAQEQRVEHHGDSQAQRPADRAEREGERGRQQCQRIGQDPAAGRGPAMRHRQHRYPGAGIIVAHEERERPEMRRRPQEDQREHQEALERDAARRHCPADHRRKGPGGTADHDVLRRAPFQPDGIDDDVEEDGEGEEQPREDIRGQRQHHAGDARKRQPEAERLALAHPPRGDRAAFGAAHQPVDVGVIPHVQRPRGAAAKRDEQDRHRRHEGMHRRRRHHQPDEGGEDHERHHPRLQQREEIAQPGLARGGGGKGGVAHPRPLSSPRPAAARRTRR